MHLKIDPQNHCIPSLIGPLMLTSRVWRSIHPHHLILNQARQVRQDIDGLLNISALVKIELAHDCTGDWKDHRRCKQMILSDTLQDCYIPCIAYSHSLALKSCSLSVQLAWIYTCIEKSSAWHSKEDIESGMNWLEPSHVYPHLTIQFFNFSGAHCFAWCRELRDKYTFLELEVIEINALR